MQLCILIGILVVVFPCTLSHDYNYDYSPVEDFHPRNLLRLTNSYNSNWDSNEKKGHSNQPGFVFSVPFEEKYKYFLIVREELAKQLMFMDPATRPATNKVIKQLKNEAFPAELSDVLDKIKPDGKVSRNKSNLLKNRLLFEVLSWKVTEVVSDHVQGVRNDVNKIVGDAITEETKATNLPAKKKIKPKGEKGKRRPVLDKHGNPIKP